MAEKAVELTISKIKNQMLKGISQIQFEDLTIDGYLLTPIVLDKNNIDDYKEFLHG